MTWEELHPTSRLVDGALDDGKGEGEVVIWRTEIEVAGHLVDATAWTPSPARASV